MKVTLYHLTSFNEHHLTPDGLLIKLAMNHLAVDYKLSSINLEHFDKKPNLPLLEDGKRKIVDTWEIVNYLERNFVDLPTLMGGEIGREHAVFFYKWIYLGLNIQIFLAIIPEIVKELNSREVELFSFLVKQNYGLSMDKIVSRQKEFKSKVKYGLVFLKEVLSDRMFFSGGQPALGDYLVLSSLQWAKEYNPKVCGHLHLNLAQWESRMELELLKQKKRNLLIAA